MSAPAVSVGLPVYNGEKFLSEALDSICNQTLVDFELIISDNASTDRTRVICEEFAARDGRIQYHRQPVNIGAARNWNAVVHLARGRYFKWASANDYCDPRFLERCVGVLDQTPDLVLAYGRTCLVDDDNNHLGVVTTDIATDAARPSDRFAKVLCEIDYNNAQAGLIRRDVLIRTGLDRLYPSGDMILMAELALYGGFWLDKEVLLYRRRGKLSFSSALSPLELQRIYVPSASRPQALRRWRKALDATGTVLQSPIAWREKLRCLQTIGRVARWQRRDLLNELLAALPMRRRKTAPT